MNFRYSVTGGGTGYGAPVLTYTSGGTVTSADLTTGATAYKLDNGSQWSISNPLPGSSSSERWMTNGTTSGTATSGASISVQYQNQYDLTITVNDPDGGSVQPSSGWQNAGRTVQLTATADSGWKFEGWSNSTSSTPTASASLALSVQVEAAVVETAVFYPGLVVTAPVSASVSYTVVNYVPGEARTGTVQPGTTQSIYVAPSSEVVLAANPTSFLYTSGWTIAGSRPTVAVEVFQPASIAPESSFDYLNIGIILAAAVLVLALVAVALSQRRRTRTWTVEGQMGYPPPEAPPPEAPPAPSAPPAPPASG